jgi:exonuclease VII large subunit
MRKTRNEASKNSVSSIRTREERMKRRKAKAKVMASRNSLERGIAALRKKTEEISDSKGIKASDN